MVERAVLEQIIEKGQVTIPTIAEIVDLSTTTVAKYFAQMVEDGKLEEIGKENASGKGLTAISKVWIPKSEGKLSPWGFRLEAGLIPITGPARPSIILRRCRNLPWQAFSLNISASLCLLKTTPKP